MKLFIWHGLALLLAIICTADQALCDMHSEDEFDLDAHISNETRASYYSMNFSDVVASCEIIPCTSDRHLGIISPQDLPKRLLTVREQLMVGTLLHPNGTRTTVGYIPGYVMDFFEQYDRFPKDGIEMLAMWNDNWIDEEGLNSFTKLTRDEQFIKGYRCINPATGKFFKSYTSKQWEPFGIWISEVAENKRYKEAIGPVYNERTDKFENGIVVVKLYHLVIYGEAKNSILIEKDFGHIISSTKLNGSRGCGGCRKKSLVKS